jgi:hypothetical protein
MYSFAVISYTDSMVALFVLNLFLLVPQELLLRLLPLMAQYIFTTEIIVSIHMAAVNSVTIIT